MTYAELQERNRLLNSSSLLAGLGSIFTLGGIGGAVYLKNPAMATIGVGAGLANIGMGIAAARKANAMRPVTVNDSATLIARPIAETLTTLPGLVLTGEGVSAVLHDKMLARGVVTPKSMIGLGMLGVGSGAMLASGYLNKILQNRIDQADATRLNILR